MKKQAKIELLKNGITAIQKRGHIGLMAHMIVGYPTLEDAVPLAQSLVEGGADILEVQIPFSDPIADGPVIMEACDVALANGVTTILAMNTIADITRSVQIPVLIMAYYNTIFSYGTKAFVQRAADIGVSGLIIPDIPPEEEPYEQFIALCEEAGIHAIRVVSPASTSQRLTKNAQLAKGFVYTSSRFGVTGAKTELDPRLNEYLARLKEVFTVPVAVGFGIRSREQVQALQGHADIAVVGSAILEVVKEKGVQSVREFIAVLLKAK
ncbi:MAG: tryptophan synthase subunit alpha [Patescibacteria group bacterium]